MSINYYSIAQPQEAELIVNKSRFISYLEPITSPDQAQTRLQEIRKEHYKANHHCWAYILGDDSNIQKLSDDGEPSGTAGMPILEVLKQNQLTYILAVVVRYFGGIKLGAGGLIRAYSSATSECLAQSQRIQNVDQNQVELVIDYKNNDGLLQSLHTHTLPLEITDTKYTDKVIHHLSIPSQELDHVMVELTDRLQGKLSWEDLGIKQINLPYH
ncbi:YigZ family protein [Eremococcus coleocola]|uniref:YigZ family protein n=1 Tax=Eremococcus coleocola ACS-139-V-Col8 TaxID=908337 RepID=E4KMY5_9LACT|nr:YigZ family protein [Eremococcus coleocola]EFR31681.1 YigZ family protein [Eremococcus coleocola ACS-139-V-Col8]